MTDLEMLLEAARAELQAARTDLNHPRVLLDAIDSDRALIEKAQRRIDRNTERLDTAAARVAEGTDRVRELAVQLKMEKHADKIEKLKKLQAQIDALSKEIGE